MQKKQLTLVVVSLLVVVLSVSVAYFTAQIIGEGKEVSVTSANLQVIFKDEDGVISSTDIEPGWTSTKTFTIKNSTKSEYKYNIVLKDLVNTFVTEGYLQYKITSTNSGYNMTEFKDVPKSSTATDTVLAYSVSIPVETIQTYTITFQYLNSTDVDQSVDMAKELSGTLFITEGTSKSTMYEQLLADKVQKSTARPDNDSGNASYGFSGVYTSNNTKTLYSSTENGTTVYYFAGNATDNWVKFGKNSSGADLYWRIIRTNADGGIRLLYHSTSPTAEDAYIDTSEFNSSYNDSKYVGYMYDSNENNSTIKDAIDTWYQNNLTNYTKYLSTTAVYCNDKTSTVSGGITDFGAYTRLVVNKTPTYDCTNISDAFSVSNTSAKLTYPIGLMTVDEISFAGGVMDITAPAYYYYNSSGSSSTGSNEWWWTMSPYFFNGSDMLVFIVIGSLDPGGLSGTYTNISGGVRPVISLKSCVKWASGDGTADSPYTIA